MTPRDRTPAVVGVAVIRRHTLRVIFDDGMVRDVQYVPGDHGSMLEHLNDPTYFKCGLTLLEPSFGRTGSTLHPRSCTVTTSRTRAWASKT